ncbi:MAG TPA: hypothetical protein PLG47_05430 [Candidatus Dojkabacteria bacterium]|nr:hypothetical protein [Candidatus Dojkabacteria bacterium]
MDYSKAGLTVAELKEEIALGKKDSSKKAIGDRSVMEALESLRNRKWVKCVSENGVVFDKSKNQYWVNSDSDKYRFIFYNTFGKGSTIFSYAVIRLFLENVFTKKEFKLYLLLRHFLQEKKPLTYSGLALRFYGDETKRNQIGSIMQKLKDKKLMKNEVILDEIKQKNKKGITYNFYTLRV